MTQVFCRIDYHLATLALAALAHTVAINKDQTFSDHAPITIGYDMSLQGFALEPVATVSARWTPALPTGMLCMLQQARWPTNIRRCNGQV